MKIFLLILVLASTTSFADDLTALLKERNELLLSTRKVKGFLYNTEVKARLNKWIANVDDEYIYACKNNLKLYFPAENILDPLCYVLRQNNPNIRNTYKDLIKRFLLETKAALKEISTDPRYEQLEKISKRFFRGPALSKYFKINQDLIDNVISCFAPALTVKYSQFNDGVRYSFLPFVQIRNCLAQYKQIDDDPFFPINLATDFSYSDLQKHVSVFHPGHAVSETSWISGNKVEYFHWNSRTLDRQDLANRKNKVMMEYLSATKDNPLTEANEPMEILSWIQNVDFDSALSKKDFKKLTSYVLAIDQQTALEFFEANDHRNLFTDEIYNFKTHPVWSQTHGIFHEINQAIHSAKETIFQDIFFFGGSMGIALAKEYMRILDSGEKPNLKIIILKDTHNYFAFKNEQVAIFNYLLAYSKKNPGKLIISGSHVEDHLSGLPSMFQNVVREDKFIISSGLRKHLYQSASDTAGLYIRAQSDHSKVIVVDGKTNYPVAFVGSKNFTDSSGAFCYDDVVKIQGPAAAVVLDDYYYDMFFALEKEMEVRHPGHVNLLSNSSPVCRQFRTIKQKIACLLKPWDLLDRDENHIPSDRAQVNVRTHPENVTVRTGFNNVDSTRTNVLDQVLQMISFAQKSIYIQDQFLFDPNVVYALIAAKKRNPALDIKILLEGLQDATPRGIPNSLYLDLLWNVGIPVKRMITTMERGIAQEFHHKTISADGKYLIVGSANKDQTTMYGAFREEQLDIANSSVTEFHDNQFLNRWNDSNGRSEEFRPYDFDLPLFFVGPDGNPIKKEDFILLLRSLVSIVFDAIRI